MLIGGAAAHATGMLAKHRIERAADRPELWWEPITYWTCWVLVIGDALALVARMSGWL
jgi:hypothetical protein